MKTDLITNFVPRLIRVAIIGLPNAGKSTLINKLTNFDLCPVSKRTHTTRKNQRAIFTKDDAQVIFVDTPGLVNKKEIKKFSFADDFVLDPENSVQNADLIAVLHDLHNAVTRNKLDPRIRALLQKFPNKNSILVINKVDLLKSKRKLLDVVRYLTAGVVGGRPIKLLEARQKEVPINKNLIFERTKQTLSDETPEMIQESNKQNSLFTPQEIDEGLDKVGWPHFHDVFMTSALEGNGVDLLQEYFRINAQPSPWEVGEDVLTDVPPAELAIRIVQSQLLEHLPHEMPYKLSPVLEYWDTDESGVLQIVIGLKSPCGRITKRVIGHGGSNILKIVHETEKVLVSLLNTNVNVSINVTEDPKTNRK